MKTTNNPHLNQAYSNELAAENENKYDWKITKLFYAALHYLHALAYEKGIDLGELHTEIEINIDPKKYGKMPVKSDIYKAYKTLHNYSKSARYGGFIDELVFAEEQKANLNDAIICFEKVKKYVLSQKVFADKEKKE